MTTCRPSCARAALERAEGNPFFLEELLAGLHDRSLPLETDVPDSVQAVLAARIDLLPPIDKAALQAASVIGRVFWRGPVRELLDGESPDFAVLEARDFIRRRSGSALAGEREFAFKHALTREVAYASCRRRGARACTPASPPGSSGSAGGPRRAAALLAHHYAEAVRPEDADLAWAGHEDELERLRAQAVAWLSRAAELAIARYELDEAIALYERALELAEPVELRSSSGGRWAARTRSSTTARGSGTPCGTRSSSARTGDGGRALRRAGLRDGHALRHVAADARLPDGRRVDRDRAPARAAGQRGAYRGADREGLLEPLPARPCAGGERDRGAARRRRAALARLGRPRDRGVRRRALRARSGLRGAALRAPRPDLGPRPPGRHPLRADLRLRLERALQRSSAARRVHDEITAP